MTCTTFKKLSPMINETKSADHFDGVMEVGLAR